MSAETWDASEHRPWAVLSKRTFTDGPGVVARTSVMLLSQGCVIRTETQERDTADYYGGYRVALVFVPGATWDDFFGKAVPRGAVEWIS